MSDVVSSALVSLSAIFFVVASGLGLSSVLPDPSPWLIAAAYLAPAGLAFAAYWWVAQRT